MCIGNILLLSWESFYSVKICLKQLAGNKLNIGISESLWGFVNHMMLTGLFHVFNTR